MPAEPLLLTVAHDEALALEQARQKRNPEAARTLATMFARYRDREIPRFLRDRARSCPTRFRGAPRNRNPDLVRVVPFVASAIIEVVPLVAAAWFADCAHRAGGAARLLKGLEYTDFAGAFVVTQAYDVVDHCSAFIASGNREAKSPSALPLSCASRTCRSCAARTLGFGWASSTGFNASGCIFSAPLTPIARNAAR